MIITRPLESVRQTGAEMRRLTEQHYTDLGRWLSAPFIHYYRHVCLLPYRPDPEDIETISRPAFTLRPEYSPRDCDDKSVLIASWFYGHGVPVRFIASSTRPDGVLHHVFVMIPGLFVDATYPKHAEMLGNYDFMPKITNYDLLTEWF